MIKNFFKNKSLVTLIAAVVCLGIIVYFYNYRVNKIIDKVSIPVAVKRLDGRSEITEDDIKMIKVARSLLSSNVITNKQMLVGKYVNYNTFVPQNGLFYSSAVVDWEEMPDSTWSNISEGKTIAYLDIIDGSSYGNLIYPGDRIDLYVELHRGGKVYYGKFVESIKVLAVKDDGGNHIFEKRPATGKPAQLIFEVDEEMFLLLNSATRMGDIKIVPVPRNAQYTIDDGATLIKGDYIKNDILKRSNMLVPDKIDEEPSNDDIQVVE